MMAAPLLAAVLAADTRLAVIDRRLAEVTRARIVAEAPLAALLGRAERLAAAPPGAERREALARFSALAHAVDTAMRPQVEALRNEESTLAAKRAALVLRRLTRTAKASREEAIPLPPPYCAAAAWRWPDDAFAVGSTIAARFGQARGTTLLTLPAAAVPAPAGARVAYAGQFRRYRGTVILDHGHGWTTLVTGLDRLTVRTDDHIGRGWSLGRAAPDLPLVGVELSRHGRAIDPALLLRRCLA